MGATMVLLNMGKDKERRTGFNDRRRYQYNDHIPERRAFRNRRNQQNSRSDHEPDSSTNGGGSKRSHSKRSQ